MRSIVNRKSQYSQLPLQKMTSLLRQKKERGTIATGLPERSGDANAEGMVQYCRQEKGEEEAYEDTCSHTNATGRKWRSGAEHDAWFL